MDEKNKQKSDENYPTHSFSETIQMKEGEIKFLSFKPEDYKNKGKGKALKKSMPVFFNPIQELNRSISLVIYKAFFRQYTLKCRKKPQKDKLHNNENKDNNQTKNNQIGNQLYNNQIDNNDLYFCDAMAASGVRTIRLKKYLEDLDVKLILNDLNPLALEIIKKNIELNNLQLNNFQFYQEDARYLLARLTNQGIFQSIIDIDPFGTPNFLIEPALKAISKDGMLCITATDTAVLFGVRPTACLRKYNVRSLRSDFLKEIGLRILIYFTLSRAHPHNLAIKPLLSMSTDHYVRVFLTVEKGKGKVSKNQKNIGYILWCKNCLWRSTIGNNLKGISWDCPVCGERIDYGGPLWTGPIFDKKFLTFSIEVLQESTYEQIPSKDKIAQILAIMEEESQFKPGFYNIHKVCKKLSIPAIKTEEIIRLIKENGYSASKTHIDPISIKTDMDLEKFKELLESNKVV